MIAVIQRVVKAKVEIDGKTHSKIENGYLVFLGILKDDGEPDIEKLSKKIVDLRIMADDRGKMNRSIFEVKGSILVVPQFTLAANLAGGRRPDFFPAMDPKGAEKLYLLFLDKLKNAYPHVKAGVFSAHMQIELINDGPVTFILDSHKI